MLRRANKLCNRPDVIGKTCFHRGSYAQAGVNPTEIVITRNAGRPFPEA
jgi:hypothetical protein